MSYLTDGLDSDIQNVEIKIFVEDDGIPSGGSQRNSEWVDWTERAEDKGKNLAMNLGVLSQTSEGRVGISSFQSSIKQIIMSNKDSFFSKPIPLADSATSSDFFGNSFKSSLKTIYDNDAYFTYTNNYQNTVYGGRKVKVDMKVVLKNGFISQGEIGTFLIENTSRTSKTCTFTLTSLAQKLIEQSAEVVKDGLGWYSNKPIGFLAEKLLKQEFADSTGELPNTFNIQKNIKIPTADSLAEKNSDTRVLSTYGRPPELSAGTETSFRANEGSDAGSTWQEKGLTCRAICAWNFGTNPDFNSCVVTSATDEATTVAVNFGSVDYGGSSSLRPVPGDSLCIKNDVTNNNDGVYEITAVSEATNTTTLTLKDSLKGSASSDMEFNISRIYMGCDNELWMYRPEKDLYTSVNTATLATESVSGYKYNVKRLWFDSNRGYIIGTAWHDSYDPDAPAGNSRLYSITTTLKVFKISFSSPNDVLTVLESSIKDVFTGEFCARYAEGSGAEMLGQGNYGAVSKNSENVLIPFPQKTIGAPIQENHDVPGYGEHALLFIDSSNIIESAASITDSPSLTSPGRTKDLETSKGYIPIIIRGDDDAGSESILRFSLGQKGFIVFNQESNDSGCIFFSKFVYDASSDEYFDYFFYDIEDDVVTTVNNGDGYKQNSIALHPTCGCANEGFASVTVGLSGWKHNDGSGTAGECRSYIATINRTTDIKYDLTVNYDSNSDGSNSYPTFLDMISIDEGTLQAYPKLLVSGIQRDKLGKNDMHFLAYYYFGDGANLLTMRKTSPTPFLQLVKDVGATTNDTIISYFADIEKGYLMQYVWDTNASTHSYSMVDNGHPFVVGDSNLASNLTLDSYTIKDSHSSVNNRGIVYGVSAPNYLAETQLDSPTGKYYLWKYDVYYSSRVELADFSGLSLWDALGLLAEKCNYLMGFEGENFFFIPRTISSTVSYTFGNIGNHKRFIDISVDDGVKEIYNSCMIIPSVVKLELPSTELSLVPPLDADDEVQRDKMKMEVIVEQRDTQTKSIKMMCVESGTLDDKMVKFKYIYYDKNIETVLSSAYEATDTQVYISSGISDIQIGDLIEVRTQERGSGTAVKEYAGTGTIKATPTTSNIENGLLRLDTILESYDVTDFTSTDSPSTYPINSKCIITKANSNKWSDRVENLITDSYFEESIADNWSTTGCAATADTSTFVIGQQSVKLASSDSSTSCMSQAITGLSTSTNYAIMGFAKTDGGITSANLAHTANLDISGTINDWTALSTTSEKWVELAGTFSTNSTTTAITIKGYSNDSNADDYVWFDSIVLVEGLGVRPDYVLAYKNDTFYEIGDSNVFIKFYDENISTEESARFEIGDIINITCPGLVLSQDSLSKQTSLNVTSIELYRRREFPAINNRFIGYKESKDFSKKVIYEYAFPHYLIRLTAKFAPYVKFLNTAKVLGTLKVIDFEIFPMDLGSGRIGYLRKIDHDCRNGKSTLLIRDKNPY